MIYKNRTFAANVDTLPAMMSFVAELIEKFPPQIVFQITLVCEEILVNIASYAYPQGDGQLAIRWEDDTEHSRFRFIFEDSGVPFNPLIKEEPVLHVPIAERTVGGLGIMMIRKLMSDVQYDHVDGKNILTITKEY